MSTVSAVRLLVLTLPSHQHLTIPPFKEAEGVDAVLKFDNGRKYYLQLHAADFEDRDLPDTFVYDVRKKSMIECQTLQLIKLSRRVTESATEVVVHSDMIVSNLLEGIRTEARHLFRMCEAVGLLDMMASFGQVVTIGDYVRPRITDSLGLKGARHPILDTVRTPTPTRVEGKLMYLTRNLSCCEANLCQTTTMPRQPIDFRSSLAAI